MAVDRYIGRPELIDAFTREPADIIRSVALVEERGASFSSLVSALQELRDLRRAIDFDRLLRERSVIGAAAVVASLVPLSLAAGVSESAPAAIEDMRLLAADTAQRSTDALLTYVSRMRELAAEHPILVVLHDASSRLISRSSVQRDAMSALRKVREAIQSLREAMEAPVVSGEPRARVAPSVESVIEAIAEASFVSVWKLPFFLDRALERLPSDEHPAIEAIRTVALERVRDRLLVRELVLTTVELATMAIPPARAVGFLLSLAAGLARLTGAVREYNEMTILYHASMDPAFLAMGEEGHVPADADMIIFDLAALMLDVHGLTKASRLF